MRAIGAGRRRIFSLVILESAWVVALGSLLGIVLTYGLSYAASRDDQPEQHLECDPLLLADYAGVIGVVWAAGLIAALMPAVIAYRTEIAKHLQASW